MSFPYAPHEPKPLLPQQSESHTSPSPQPTYEPGLEVYNPGNYPTQSTSQQNITQNVYVNQLPPNAAPPAQGGNGAWNGVYTGNGPQGSGYVADNKGGERPVIGGRDPRQDMNPQEREKQRRQDDRAAGICAGCSAAACCCYCVVM